MLGAAATVAVNRSPLGPDPALLGTRSRIIQPLRSSYITRRVSTVQYPQSLPTLPLRPDKARRIAYHLTSRQA
jgi:hypothetical protein